MESGNVEEEKSSGSDDYGDSGSGMEDRRDASDVGDGKEK